GGIRQATRAAWEKSREYWKRGEPTEEDRDYAFRLAQHIGEKVEELKESDPAAAKMALEGLWEPVRVLPAGIVPAREAPSRRLWAPVALRVGGGTRQEDVPPPAPARLLDGGYGAAFHMTVGAAAVLFLDGLAQAVLPGFFGFSAAPALWVALGLGGVAVPLMAVSRAELAKDADVRLRPLKRSFDLVLGAFAGAVILTLAGLPLGGLAALLSAGITPAGLLAPGPFLGLAALIAGFRFSVSAPQAAYALKSGAFVSPGLPLPTPLKVFLLAPTMLMTLPFFLSLSFGALGGWLSAAAAAATWLIYHLAGRHLAGLRAATGRMRDVVLDGGAAPGLKKEEAAQAAPLQNPARRTWRSLGWLTLLLGVTAAFIGGHFALGGALPSWGLALKSMLFGLPILLAGSLVLPRLFGGVPLEQGTSLELAREIARKAGIPVPKVYSVPMKDPNAAATGAFHRLSAVMVSPAIERLLSLRELRAVLAHELGHIRFRHMLYVLPAALAATLLPAAAGSLLQLALIYWAPLVWTLLFLALMRSNEDQADAAGAAWTGEPGALASSLRKLSILQAVTSGLPMGLGNRVSALFRTHPPTAERIAMLEPGLTETPAAPSGSIKGDGVGWIRREKIAAGLQGTVFLLLVPVLSHAAFGALHVAAPAAVTWLFAAAPLATVALVFFLQSMVPAIGAAFLITWAVGRRAGWGTAVLVAGLSLFWEGIKAALLSLAGFPMLAPLGLGLVFLASVAGEEAVYRGAV
ncbi:MAG: heat shock protein HtpX, partial [Elusimicrobia bacterium]